MSPTLYQLALNKTCLHLFEKSSLSTLYAQFTHKYKKTYPDEESEDVKGYQKKVNAVLEGIQDRLEQTGKVPLQLRNMIMSVINSLLASMNGFLEEMVRGLSRKTLSNVMFCAQHVVYTDNLSIDITESVCNILHKSQFDVMFTSSFLASYCIKKCKLRSVYVQVCNELDKDENADATRRRKSKRCSRQIEGSKMEDVFEFIEDMTTGKKYWEKRRFKDGMQDANNNMAYASDMQYVGVLGSFDALKYYYERACRKVRGPHLDDIIYDCAKYLFLVNSGSGQKLAFFQEKLDAEMWAELLRDNFDGIFLTYLASWRYRERCMPLFCQVKDKIDIKIFHSILREVSHLLEDKYNSYGIMAVVKQFWDEVPRVWKTHCETIELVSSLLVPGKKFDGLPHFLNEYSIEVQENIFASMIFQIVSLSGETHVQALMEAAQELGLKQKEGKEFLTKERLQNLLICDARNFTTVDYSKVSKYLCSSAEEESELRQALLCDKYFIIDFLVNIDYSLQPFLKWAFKNETEIDAFKAKLFEDELLERVYERRLIEVNDFYGANRIFSGKMLNINTQQKVAVQKGMKDYTPVMYWCLSKCFEDRWFSIRAFFEDFDFTKEESLELMREWLYLPETINAVYDMVLDLPNFDKSISCSKEGSRLMLTWINFITDIVKPYTDVNDYKHMLLSDIDTVVNSCYEKVQRHPTFGRLQNAEYNIKIRFRCFTLCFEEENLVFRVENNLLFDRTHPMPFMFGLVLAYIQ